VFLVSTALVLQPLQQLTRDIPIVFTQISDPVGSGFIASLAHPGGNVTGFTPAESELVEPRRVRRQRGSAPASSRAWRGRVATPPAELAHQRAGDSDRPNSKLSRTISLRRVSEGVSDQHVRVSAKALD
jgi:ABC transporter substrate binding protein